MMDKGGASRIDKYPHCVIGKEDRTNVIGAYARRNEIQYIEIKAWS
jgi:hypothetical protein